MLNVKLWGLKVEIKDSYTSERKLQDSKTLSSQRAQTIILSLSSLLTEQDELLVVAKRLRELDIDPHATHIEYFVVKILE